MWWERDGWICDQVDYASIICGSPDEYHARCALELLVVILHDRNTLKVEARPRLRSNHLKRFGLNKRQPEGVQEITLYCPSHFSTADGDTHARPGCTIAPSTYAISPTARVAIPRIGRS
jgi:hypothetical protein